MSIPSFKVDMLDRIRDVICEHYRVPVEEFRKPGGVRRLQARQALSWGANKLFGIKGREISEYLDWNGNSALNAGNIWAKKGFDISLVNRLKELV